MKHFTILLAALVLFSTSFAQLTKRVGNTPAVMTSVKSKSLPMPNNGAKSVVTTLHYDGVNDNGIGTGSAANFGVYAKFPDSVMTPLVGDYITSVDIYINGVTDVSAVELRLYNDTITPVFTQAVTGLVEGWNTVVLNPSYAITAADLLVGYNVTTTGGYPAGNDAGPHEANGYGDIMYFGSWTTAHDISATLDLNWNIRATVKDSAITCFPPTGLTYTNLTYNSVDLAWTSSASSWNLKISSTVIDPATGTGDIYDGTVTSATYSATGLSELTDYYVYIQSVCSSSNTSTWLSSQFSTPKNCTSGNTAPWVDDMSNGIDCWSLYDVDNDGFNWEVGEVVTGETTLNSFSYDNGTATALTPNNWAVTNKINIDALTTPYLSWKAMSFDANWVSEQYSVYISTTGNTPSDFGTAVFNETFTSDDVVYRSVDLSSYSGDIWIAFRHHDVTDMFGMAIDDVRVDNTLSVNSSLVNSAELSIYPNPANEKVTIANAEGQKVVILDITGKVVYTIDNASQLQEVNTSDLPVGTYIVRVNSSVSRFNVIR